MKQIDKLVLKNFIGPFILTTAVVVFIFLMRFLMMYFEDFVGKDIGLSVFSQLLLYFSLITVPVALPLSTLLAALVSFGNLGEHTELTAMKSAGIPLTRILVSTFIFSLLVAGFSFWYNNTVTPWANLKGYSMLWDIKTTKVTLNIKEGIFYREIPGYSIKVKEKDPNSDLLKGVMIYNHSTRDGNSNVTVADSGKMYTMYNDSYLVFELFDGKNYSEQKNRTDQFNNTSLFVNKFTKNKMVFSLESFGMKRTDENQFKYHEYMKNIEELNAQIDSSKAEIQRSKKTQIRSAKNMNTYQFKRTLAASLKKNKKDSLNVVEVLPGPWVDEALAELKKSYRITEVEAAVKSNIKSFKNQFKTNSGVLATKQKEMRRADVEKWHKFTFAFACIAMFIIGASLGSIIKKGGFGLPVVVAVSFFIFYYVLMQLGDKYAKEGLIPVITGVWFPNTVLLTIGIYLALKATQDAKLFDFDNDSKLWRAVKSWLKNKGLIKKALP